MEQELIRQAPVAAAVAAIVALFLRHIADQRNKDRKMWENHLSESVQAQTRTASALEQVSHELRLMADRLLR